MRELRTDDSTNVRRLLWRPDNTLEVEFTSGATYRYSNVQKHQFETACGAESVGAYVAKTFVRNAKAYPFEKVMSEAEAADAQEKANLDASLEATVCRTYKNALESIADHKFGPEDEPHEAVHLFMAIATRALGRPT